MAACLLFGRNAGRHRLFAEHLTAEYYITTEGRGRTVNEWTLPAHKPDNHWFDCLVGWPGSGCPATQAPEAFRIAEDEAMKQDIDREQDRAYHNRGIECQNCGCRHFRVIYTCAVRGGKIMRRRECRHCRNRITTWETQAAQ